MGNVTKIWVSVPDVEAAEVVKEAIRHTSNNLIQVIDELPIPISNLNRYTGVVAYVSVGQLGEDQWSSRLETRWFHCVAQLNRTEEFNHTYVWRVYLHKSVFHQTGLHPSYLDRKCDNILHFLNFGHLYKQS